MNAELFSVVKEIVEKHSDSVLADPRRVSAFLADMAQEVPKPQKGTFIKCLEQGFAQILKNAAETDRANCKLQLAQRLNKDEGLDIHLCEESLALLAAVLFGEEEVTAIMDRAFQGKQLTSFAIPEGVTAIGKWAFYKNQLTSITIPNSVTIIGECAFSENLLTSIVVPGSLTKIEYATFFENHLESVIIPNSVTTIDRMAFCRNILTSITIGANVELGGSKNRDSFDRGFDDFYKKHGSKAGTYIYGIGGWRLQ